MVDTLESAEVLTREQLVTKLRDLRASFANQGVTSMTLFGSRARGDNRPDSDIDLMIDVDPMRKFSLLDLIGVAHTVEDQVRLPADIFMRRSLGSSLLATAKRDAIPVF